MSPMSQDWTMGSLAERVSARIFYFSIYINNLSTDFLKFPYPYPHP
jgi:hypothetical protein